MSRLRPLLLVSLVLLLLAAFAAWLFPQQILTVDSGDVKADVLVVLGGGEQERPQRAAELFNERAAPRIILTGFGDNQRKKQWLISAGVPEVAIAVENQARTTKENAQFTIPLLRKLAAERQAQGAERPLRVILVTSWYHSRRALHCFEHYAPDLQLFSRPSYYGYPGKAQSGEREAPAADRKAMNRYTRSEYVKLLGYWVRWGICPL